MTRITVSEDCDNSPKNKFVQQLSIALAVGDSATLLDSVSDDVYWNIIGQASFQGKDGLVDALHILEPEQVAELAIEHVLTHGRAGAVNGTTILMDGTTRAFCDVYEFSSVKGTHVTAITSYRIGIDHSGQPGGGT